MALDYRVRITPDEAERIITDKVVNGSVSGELIDRYSSEHIEGQKIIVLVFEKYFMRNSSRASLTVTIENMRDITMVHAVGSGGGQGALFKFDWGASDSFIDQVTKAVEEYII